MEGWEQKHLADYNLQYRNHNLQHDTDYFCTTIHRVRQKKRDTQIPGLYFSNTESFLHLVERRVYIQIFQDSLDNAACVSLKPIRATEGSITTRNQTQKTVWCIRFVCSNNTTSSWNSINNIRPQMSWKRAPLNNQKG